MALTVSSQCANGPTSVRYCVEFNCELCFETTIHRMDITYSTISVFMVILTTTFCASTTPDRTTKNQICVTNAGKGTCVKLKSCFYALKLLENGDRDMLTMLHCGFEDSFPKVCCPTEEVPILYNYNEETATNIPKHFLTLKPEMKSTFDPDIKMQTVKTFPNRTICGKYAAVDNRIVGGTITEVDKHPWLARIRYKIDGKDVFSCAAGLITDQYLLTAAHCNQKYKPIGIRLGEWNTETNTDCYKEKCNKKTIDVKIRKIINHPKFEKLNNDIALIQLEEAVTFTDFIQPLCLPTTEYTILQDYSADSVYLAAGWGETELESASVVKRQVELNAVQFDICRNIYRLETSYENNIICVGGIKGKDTCSGDSGGPLIKAVSENYEVNWYLFGITSSGLPKCGIEGVPGMYTRVSAYMDWIRKVISK